MNKLLALAPKREDFPSLEAYEEAAAYFRHRMRGVIRSRSLGSRPQSKSQVAPTSPPDLSSLLGE